MKRFFQEREQSALPEFDRILHAMPKNSAERYMADSRGPWTRWAVRFVDFYGKCSPEDRQKVADIMAKEFSNVVIYLPKDLHVVEILWDFAKDSAFFAELPQLFHALVKRWQETLAPAEFQNEVVNRLRGGGIIPRSYWQQYDRHEQIPSNESRIRLSNITQDIVRETKLLTSHELPVDADDMLHMLRKMRKGKIHLPEFYLTFLAEVQQRFSESAEWSEMQQEIDKIKKKFAEWAATQVPLSPVVTEIR